MEGDFFGYFIEYVFLGAIVGVLSGLFGIGGGLIIVPALVWLFTIQGIQGELVMLMAIATSLATIIVTSIASVYAHHSRHNAVLWDVVWKLVPGLLIGALLGAVVADNLPTDVLRTVFAIFLMGVSLQMWKGNKTSDNTERGPKYPFFLVGGMIGTLSAVLGIGGGTLTVPYLVKKRIAMGNAVAISSACGLPIAIFGTLGYTVLGWNSTALSEPSFGYIYLPAFIGIISASLFCAPIGAKLAHKVPGAKLKRVFAILICIIGIGLIWCNYSDPHSQIRQTVRIMRG